MNLLFVIIFRNIWIELFRLAVSFVHDCSRSYIRLANWIWYISVVQIWTWLNKIIIFTWKLNWIRTRRRMRYVIDHERVYLTVINNRHLVNIKFLHFYVNQWVTSKRKIRIRQLHQVKRKIESFLKMRSYNMAWMTMNNLVLQFKIYFSNTHTHTHTLLFLFECYLYLHR